MDFVIKENNIWCFTLVADIYSVLPVYGISKWHDRKGAVVESALTELLQDVNSKVTLSSLLFRYHECVSYIFVRRGTLVNFA